MQRRTIEYIIEMTGITVYNVTEQFRQDLLKFIRESDAGKVYNMSRMSGNYLNSVLLTTKLLSDLEIDMNTILLVLARNKAERISVGKQPDTEIDQHYEIDDRFVTYRPNVLHQLRGKLFAVNK